ncbi:baseplate J/gp47 family protein [Halomonas sp. H33-56]|uniref:baseplate J/gp47 family protein n=1 Tax=Halomonas sp. H33-56 TaxID=2950873 RepID=UPI0032DFF3F9
MAFQRPTLAQLIERTNADVASRLPAGRGAVLRRSALGVLARALAGLSHLLHGHLDYNARQLLPDTADSEHLRRHASLWKIQPTPATYASGPVTLTGTGNVAADTVLQRDDGREYLVATGVVLSGSGEVTVTAREPGSDGNVEAGLAMSLLSPVPGIDSTGTVAAGGIAGGADPESDPRVLTRLLKRMQEPPQGGSDPDYEQWALAVPDVTRAWVYRRWLGAGTVGVAFVCDDLDPIIPDAAKVAEVQAAIDAERPVTAEPVAFAPTEAPLSPTISGLTPNTPEVRAAIAAELADLVKREAEPGGTLLISHIREAISVAAGESDHVLETPTADVSHPAGTMAVMGVITWA